LRRPQNFVSIGLWSLNRFTHGVSAGGAIGGMTLSATSFTTPPAAGSMCTGIGAL
jgi:hypothetical protein